MEKRIKEPKSPEPLQTEKETEELVKGERKSSLKFYKRIGLLAVCLAMAAGILLYQTRAPGTTKQTEKREKKTAAGQPETVDDYSKIYSYITKQQQTRTFDGGMVDTLSDGETTESAYSKSGYSETNTRHGEVDEADVVKTDGKYLYILKDNSAEIAIVDAGEKLRKVGAISVPEDLEIREFFLLTGEKKLIAAANVNEESTKVITYDISNPKKPGKLGEVSQSGTYSSSRISDGYLYLFSDYWISEGATEKKPETYIPMAGDSLIRENHIILPPFESACMYEVATAISPERPSEIADSRAFCTNGGELYVSSKNVYYYETEFSESGETTKITRIGYAEGIFSEAASGSIEGYIDDSFSVDEYEDHLRIVVTSGESNAVYVLDKDMEICGSIEDLAKDEQVYSARFLGDTGYFVTFRQVDPLFSVDLSDPKEPKIIGKLKIPGFSEYLHFYGENQLLGIGMSADEDSGVTEGVKLSMFDISDKTDVKEVQTYTLKNVYSTDVFYDYRGVLIDVEKNLIGFSASAEGGDRYYVFGFDEKEGFQCNLSEEINGSEMRGARGVYIGETLYVVKGNVIEAYSLKTYKKTDDIIL